MTALKERYSVITQPTFQTRIIFSKIGPNIPHRLSDSYLSKKNGINTKVVYSTFNWSIKNNHMISKRSYSWTWVLMTTIPNEVVRSMLLEVHFCTSLKFGGKTYTKVGSNSASFFFLVEFGYTKIKVGQSRQEAEQGVRGRGEERKEGKKKARRIDIKHRKNGVCLNASEKPTINYRPPKHWPYLQQQQKKDYGHEQKIDVNEVLLNIREQLQQHLILIVVSTALFRRTIIKEKRSVPFFSCAYWHGVGKSLRKVPILHIDGTTSENFAYVKKKSSSMSHILLNIFPVLMTLDPYGSI